jgi:hypothetical protein
MTSDTPGAVRVFYRDAEQRLRDMYPAGLPQAAQEWIMRARRIARMPDVELQELIDSGKDIPEQDIHSAVAWFGAIYSNPALRLTEGLPGELIGACRRIMDTAAMPACRHVLAGAAISATVPVSMCLAHPDLARCPDCHTRHVLGEHDDRAELLCDYCGAQCLNQIFPVVIPLGSIMAVRNLAARRSFAVGPAAITGLGACYHCRRDVIGRSKTVAEVFAELDPL